MGPQINSLKVFWLHETWFILTIVGAWGCKYSFFHWYSSNNLSYFQMHKIRFIFNCCLFKFLSGDSGTDYSCDFKYKIKSIWNTAFQLHKTWFIYFGMIWKLQTCIKFFSLSRTWYNSKYFFISFQNALKLFHF